MEKLKHIKEKVKNKIQHFIDNHKWEVVAVGVIIIKIIIPAATARQVFLWNIHKCLASSGKHLIFCFIFSIIILSPYLDRGVYFNPSIKYSVKYTKT